MDECTDTKLALSKWALGKWALGKWGSAVGAGLAMMALHALAAEPPTQIPPTQVEEQSVTVEATVTAIDHQTRMVTLQSADGSAMEIKAGPAVKRLDEINKGDGVELTYYESLVMSIVPVELAGQPQAMVTDAAGRAPGTEPPAGAVGRQVEAIVEITAIDTDAGTVDVRGAEGDIVTVSARHPENLARIKVGDRVHIVYTEAVAVAIVPRDE